MSYNPFAEWLEEVATDRIVVDTADIIAECRPNTWSLSVSSEQAQVVTVQNVDVILFENDLGDIYY